jgi:SAM-dependent methyltransferase
MFEHLLRYFLAYRDHKFDRRYGTDTGGIVHLDLLTVIGGNVEHGRYHQAIWVKWFRRAMAGVHDDWKNFVFVDYGCGKGRGVLLATDYPFKKIIGIEFAREFCVIAEQNIQIFLKKSARPNNLEIMWMDAETFSLPNENTVFLFYNPFGEKVMRKVLSNIKESLNRCPRRIFIIYAYPLLADMFKASGFLNEICAMKGDVRLKLGCRIYTNVTALLIQ